MRVLIFHGYLLEGTGSNVYNARLAAALVELGHEVHLLSQDRHPERQPFVDAAGDWDGGELCVRALRPRGAHERVRCTVYRPNIGTLLPVYVADRYEGMQARTFAECSDAEVADYIDANVAAVREVVARASPDVALANHLVMGPVILARALGPGTSTGKASVSETAARGASSRKVPYAVKVHGSALEYTVKPHPERFLDPAREGIAGAESVLVGSHHTAGSLWRALGDPEIEERTRLGPPGVDIDRFVPRDRPAAHAGLDALVARLRARAGAGTGTGAGGRAPTAMFGAEMLGVEAVGDEGFSGDAGKHTPDEDAFARDDDAAAHALASIDLEHDRLVGFVGKLIVNKGVDLLIAAWPLVLERVSQAKLVVVGFGADRDPMERLLGMLAAGDLGQAQDIALPHLRAFLRDLSGEGRDRYLTAARELPERVVFTGRLDHDELTELLPACEALVVPSTFPEAFGMVAAEAAACGALPISAAHSGLAEVSKELAHAVPDTVAPWLSFAIDDSAVPALAERILAWLTVDPELREQTRAGLVETVRERWSWEGVARGVIAAARGELDVLPRP